MKFFIASHHHELLPLAHRLRRENHEVEVLVWRPRYEKAWDGALTKALRHSDNVIMAEALQQQITEAQKGNLAVITNIKRIAELFQGAKLLYVNGPESVHLERDPLWFGGWFDGEAIQAPHLLVYDWGPWTGGTGDLSVPGGIVLVRLHAFPQNIQRAVDTIRDRLKTASYRGLFGFDLMEQIQSGELEQRNLQSGWPWLHLSAFMAETKNLGRAIAGVQPPELAHKFVAVLPVTIPPWPSEKRGETVPGQPIEGLTIQQQGQCFWFDMCVDQERKKLLSAGLDGLLCVTTGSSDSTPALARARALELAHKIQIPGKQYRMDMGGLADRVLSTLEDRYGFVV